MTLSIWRAPLAALLCVLAASPATAYNSKAALQRDLFDFALSACLQHVGTPELKAQAAIVAQRVIERGRGDAAVWEALAAEVRHASRGANDAALVGEHAMTGAQAALAFCLDTTRSPETVAAMSKARTGLRRSYSRPLP